MDSKRRTKKTMLTVVSLALMAGLTATASEKLTLVKDNAPVATIVMATNATKAAQFAAYELQWHIKQISGATLPILRDAAKVPVEHVRVYVGDGPCARALGLTPESFKLQEYAVKSGANEIMLLGKDAADFTEVKYNLDALNDGRKNANWPDFWEEQGTLHAVYDFLRDACGLRWFNPTDAGTLIPRQATLTVKGMNLRRAPTFRYRDAIWSGLDSYDNEVSLWQSESPASPKVERFKAWEAAAYTNLHQHYGSDLDAKRNATRLFLLRMKNGGERCSCCHSLYHYADLYWATNANPEAAKYFVGKRPEIFAQGYQENPPPQLCYTRRDVAELVAQEARDYFDKGGYPYKATLSMAPRGLQWGANFFSVEAMDNPSFCKCAECQKWHDRGKDYGAEKFWSQGMHSDYWFNFVNQVAAELKKTHPDKRIVTLAYMTHAFVPKSIALNPDVAVQFCFAYDGAPWTEEYRHELELLRAWVKEAQTSGRPLYAWFFLGHAARLGSRYGGYNGFPPYIAHAIGEEMRLFKQAGGRGMFQGRLPTEADTYVMFRLMDNADLDVDALLDEYYTGLYGAAGAPLKKLYLAMEKLICDPKAHPDKNKGISGQEEDWGYLGTAERMAGYGKLVEEARRLAGTEREKQNMAIFELSTWKYMIQGREQYLAGAQQQFEIRKAPKRIPFAGASRDAREKTDWSEALLLTDWRSHMGDHVEGGPSALLLTDGETLHITLAVTAKSLRQDDRNTPWRIVFAAQRGAPERVLRIGADAKISATERDTNGVERAWDAGAVAQRDKRGKDGVEAIRLALPLSQLLPGVDKPTRLFMNLGRVGDDGAVQAAYLPTSGTFYEATRLCEFVLDGPESIPTGVPDAKAWGETRSKCLVGNWRLDKGEDDRVLDASGHGLDGKLVNGPAVIEKKPGRALSPAEVYAEYSSGK